jgi:large subunit ribosomal protein L25
LSKNILHLDFLRVDAKSEVDVKVPIRLLGEDECPGVVEESGSIDQTFTAIDVKCQADQIPEAIFVDISELKLHDSIHFSDIEFPKGVTSSLEINEEHDPAILTIHPPTKEEVVEIVEDDLDEEMEEGDEEIMDDDAKEEQPQIEAEKH